MPRRIKDDLENRQKRVPAESDKFAAGTILCMVLIAVFVPISAKDYQQRLKDYNDNVSANEVKLGEGKAYKVLTPSI